MVFVRNDFLMGGIKIKFSVPSRPLFSLTTAVRKAQCNVIAELSIGKVFIYFPHSGFAQVKLPLASLRKSSIMIVFVFRVKRIKVITTA